MPEGITCRSRWAVGEWERVSRLFPYSKCLALLENKDFLCTLTQRNETRLKSLLLFKHGGMCEGRGRKQPPALGGSPTPDGRLPPAP